MKKETCYKSLKKKLWANKKRSQSKNAMMSGHQWDSIKQHDVKCHLALKCIYTVKNSEKKPIEFDN